MHMIYIYYIDSVIKKKSLFKERTWGGAIELLPHVKGLWLPLELLNIFFVLSVIMGLSYSFFSNSLWSFKLIINYLNVLFVDSLLFSLFNTCVYYQTSSGQITRASFAGCVPVFKCMCMLILVFSCCNLLNSRVKLIKISMFNYHP